ncbi:hypothetical protein D3C80_1274630 [compost metagenome]
MSAEELEEFKSLDSGLCSIAEMIKQSPQPEIIYMSSDMAEELGIDVDALPHENEHGEIVERCTGSAGDMNTACSGPRAVGCSSIGQAQSPIGSRWIVTLQMLEERLRFEHQGMAANQLKEIREYLETK